MYSLKELIDITNLNYSGGNPSKLHVTDITSDPYRSSQNTILLSESLAQSEICVAFDRGCRIFFQCDKNRLPKGALRLSSDEYSASVSKLCKILNPVPINTKIITVSGDRGVATAGLILSDILYKLGKNPVYFGYGDSVITHELRGMYNSHQLSELSALMSSLCADKYDTVVLHKASTLYDCYASDADNIALDNTNSVHYDIIREYVDDGIVYTEFVLNSAQFIAPYTRNTTVSCVVPCIKYLLSSGYSAESIASVLPNVRSLGRSFPIGGISSKAIIVDSARTKDSLEYIFGEYSRIFSNITTVIGSVGTYAHERRKEIADAINNFCSYAVLTSDDPGYEDPQSICNEIKAMLDSNIKCDIEIDRATAIELAVSNSPADSAVLILGKGYENVQIIGGNKFPFDDMITAQIIVNKKDR